MTMLAEKTLSQSTIEMRLVDQADKLEKLLLSEEEIATLEKLAMSGVFDSETTAVAVVAVVVVEAAAVVAVVVVDLALAVVAVVAVNLPMMGQHQI
jgi:hypothetical protein